MQLIHSTLRPGRVLEHLDGGRIKVSAPGLFSAEDQEFLPPVYPLLQAFTNSFSKPEIGDEVWVLNQADNPMSLHWIRKDDHNMNWKDMLGEEGVECIVHKVSGAGYASLYFTDGQGWIIRNDQSYIQLDPNGDIRLDTKLDKRYIHLEPKGIRLGGSEEKAAYGEKVEDALNQIHMMFELIKQAANTNIYTKPIGMALTGKPEVLKKMIPKVSSPHVTIA